MRLVYPFVDKEPNMVLIEGLQGRQIPSDGGKNHSLYTKSRGVYMPEIYDIYGY